eukprot:TRINITY_DN1_c0_g1_i12.p2 TRINITY_DN1_c0_g1~~TRINITY_DN1_c0_g1_i12.p2  ORF type:complete len:254 (-),score=101.00 TRINITY_DN1_c0_g1_i12:263-1024(-)
MSIMRSLVVSIFAFCLFTPAACKEPDFSKQNLRGKDGQELKDSEAKLAEVDTEEEDPDEDPLSKAVQELKDSKKEIRAAKKFIHDHDAAAGLSQEDDEEADETDAGEHGEGAIAEEAQDGGEEQESELSEEEIEAGETDPGEHGEGAIAEEAQDGGEEQESELSEEEIEAGETDSGEDGEGAISEAAKAKHVQEVNEARARAGKEIGLSQEEIEAGETDPGEHGEGAIAEAAQAKHEQEWKHPHAAADPVHGY